MTWSLSLFFGWILSFPYYGAVLQAVPQIADISASYYIYVFLLFHALGYLSCALLLKNHYSWNRLMVLSVAGTILINFVTWFSPATWWFYGLALMGFTSSFYVVGWSNYYSALNPRDRAYVIIHATIRANLIALIIMASSTLLSGLPLFSILILPLVLSLVLVIMVGNLVIDVLPESKVPFFKARSFPGSYLLVICLFIASFKVSAGFMYVVIHDSYPAVEGHQVFFEYYPYVPYLLTYLVVLKIYHVVQKHYLAVAAALLLGLSFIGFALIGDSAGGFIASTTFVEVSFALVTVFAWTLLGDLSAVYGKPHYFFGFGLFANVISTFGGSLIGEYLLLHVESPLYVIALYAAAAVFLVLVIIPWLKDKTASTLAQVVTGRVKVVPFVTKNIGVDLLGLSKLTPREKEILYLIVGGFSNRDMTRQLYISENTLKTHLRNIYRKFGVHTKYELVARIANKELALKK